MSTTLPDAVAESSGETGETGAATGTVNVVAALDTVNADLSTPGGSAIGAQPADICAKRNKASHAVAIAAIPIDPKSSKLEPIAPPLLEAKLVLLVNMIIS